MWLGFNLEIVGQAVLKSIILRMYNVWRLAILKEASKGMTCSEDMVAFFYYAVFVDE